MYPATERLLGFFTYADLPENQQVVSRGCCILAEMIALTFPDGSAEVTDGLWKLLEAKDCFIRAMVEKRGA